jgi:hypothetical protein
MNPVHLTDKSTRNHIKLVFKDGAWERWESKDKINWIKTHDSLSFDYVMRTQEEIKNKNYLNLFKIIFR